MFPVQHNSNPFKLNGWPQLCGANSVIYFNSSFCRVIFLKTVSVPNRYKSGIECKIEMYQASSFPLNNLCQTEQMRLATAASFSKKLAQASTSIFWLWNDLLFRSSYNGSTGAPKGAVLKRFGLLFEQNRTVGKIASDPFWPLPLTASSEPSQTSLLSPWLLTGASLGS